MRIAIVGAGAMGCLLGHGLCRSGNEVSLIDLPARVADLRANRELTVIGPEGLQSSVTPAQITSDYSKAGIHELVVLATKAHDLPAVADCIAGLVNEQSSIMTIQNGIPWWYLHGFQDEFGTARINCLDPDGLLEQNIAPVQIVGCVAYPAAIVEPDGRIRHVEGLRLPVGECDNLPRERTHMIAQVLNESGFKSRVIEDIRSEIWLKAWGALTINPVSALTRTTMEEICTFPGTHELIAQMMHEAQQVAEALGAKFRHTIEERIQGARRVGQHKTSMLQDLENGQPLELDALMLAVLELAQLTGKKTPTIQTVYACAALLNENLRAVHNRAGAVADSTFRN
ncbi:MAG TPA: 2-dehydropantoate 2-reductase [Xanthomonadales bacterium]|nr:2-dehydropantoate 2-reductase [Xanthomonadales bacterium]